MQVDPLVDLTCLTHPLTNSFWIATTEKVHNFKKEWEGGRKKAHWQTHSQSKNLLHICLSACCLQTALQEGQRRHYLLCMLVRRYSRHPSMGLPLAEQSLAAQVPHVLFSKRACARLSGEP